MPNASEPSIAKTNIAKSSKFAIAAASPVRYACGRIVRVPPPVCNLRPVQAAGPLTSVYAIVADCALH